MRPRMMRLVLAVTLVALPACRPPGYGGDDAVDPVDARHGGPDGRPADAAVDATAVECDAAFRLDGFADASVALLTGDFAGWAGSVPDGATALALGDDGAWSARRTFSHGLHLYKFIVDGAWIPDPANPDAIDDGFGGLNSVYRCGG
jgi:hypothetical protein